MENYYSRIDSHHGKVFSYEELKNCTHQFSEANYIGRFQFGKVYRGTITVDSDVSEVREVIVKIWIPNKYYVVDPGVNKVSLEEEVILLKHPTMVSHPNLVKVIGYCSNGEQLGVVYDLKPLNSVHNLMLEESFSWVRRIKVALEFACLLEYFHSPREPYCPYQIRNVDANHIMLDQDYNSKLFDFSMIAGGIFPERKEIASRGPLGCHGYRCFDYLSEVGRSCWTDKYDVLSFGVLLLSLTSKRVFNLEEAEKLGADEIRTVYEWAEAEYCKAKKSFMGFFQPNRSLVHPSFNAESEFYSSDGPKITKLAMQCVKEVGSQRPTMKQVVDHLLNLQVVRVHADRLGIGGLVRSYDLTDKMIICELNKFLFGAVHENFQAFVYICRLMLPEGAIMSIVMLDLVRPNLAFCCRRKLVWQNGSSTDSGIDCNYT